MKERLKEKIKENRKTIVGIVLLVVMVIGFSYAWFQLTLRGEKENVLKAGTLSLILDDTMGDGISIANGVPMTDEDGLKTVPYTFTLENNGTLDSDYTIYLDDLDLLEGETRMPDSAIKYYLTKDGSDLGLDLLSETGENPNRILDSGVIAPGEKYTYTLRLWIADTATNEIMGTTFRGQIRVESIQAASKAFAVYSEDDKSLRFYNRTDTPSIGETYEGLIATAVYTGVEQLEATKNTEIPWNTYANGIEKVVVADEISPVSTAYWFYNVGYDATAFEMDLLKLDTSNVTNMSYMFYSAGNNATTWSIGDISGWNTSKVTDMSYMFKYAGFSAATWSVGDIDDWNTSNVTSMRGMFSGAGKKSTTFELDLSNLNTSNVTNMASMFSNAGSNDSTFELDLSNWDTSNVTNMSYMFDSAGTYSTTWSIGDINGWNTSKVTDMSYMFSGAGRSATTFELDLSNLDTSNVEDMRGMFQAVGYANDNCVTINLNLSNWDTSKVEDMAYMFQNAGYRTTTINLNLSSWNTSNVTHMHNMFYSVGYNASTINIEGLGDWNTSSLINIASIFKNIGYNATTLSIEGINNWDTSNVVQMEYAFSYAGYNAEPFTLNLSGWDTSSMQTMGYIFEGCRRLKEITLGANFSFKRSDGTLLTNQYLPVPSAEDIAGADGYWYNVDTGTAYLPDKIPNNTAATYVASPSLLP